MTFFHLESTLEELTLYPFQVEDTCLGQAVYEIFDENPSLPGVVLLRQGTLVGMISRRRFWQRLSRAFGRELFLRRPIAVLYKFIQVEPLVLPGTTPVTEAAQQALERPPKLLDEPVVVEITPQVYQLLDMHELLVAQSSIHQLTSQLLQQKTRTEMMHTEKLASLGKLLAGLAHEIRNPVNFIGGNLHHLEEYCQDLIRIVQAYKTELTAPSQTLAGLEKKADLDFMLHDLPKVIDSIAMGTHRLQSLVTSLRTFSRMDESEQSETDLHQSLEGTLLILSSQLNQGVQVIKEYGDLPRLKCYPGQIGQVFMNLLSNAIDALLEHEAQLTRTKALDEVSVGSTLVTTTTRAWEPQITITTSVVSGISVPFLGRAVACDRYISIRIRDNGPGIPPLLHKRVFEDFFTTKSAGKGTGLGLPITAQIVEEKHGGRLGLRSPCLFPTDGTPPSGTEFEILLPLNRQA